MLIIRGHTTTVEWMLVEKNLMPSVWMCAVLVYWLCLLPTSRVQHLLDKFLKILGRMQQCIPGKNKCINVKQIPFEGRRGMAELHRVAHCVDCTLKTEVINDNKNLCLPTTVVFS